MNHTSVDGTDNLVMPANEEALTSNPTRNEVPSEDTLVASPNEESSEQNLRKVGKSNRIAIHVEGAKKKYGKRQVLMGANMHVREGTIYGLLGASESGKSTLLSCIVNTKKLDEGQILIYGKKPGTKGSGVPGYLVGYMPQELGLDEEFKIMEVCEYFGMLYGIKKTDVREKVKSLVELLGLQECTGRLSTFRRFTKSVVKLCATSPFDIKTNPCTFVVMHNWYRYKLSDVDDEEKITGPFFCQTVRVAHNFNRDFVNLLLGEKRLTSLLVAVLHDPLVLILDEPTTGVDPVVRQKIWAFIRNLSDTLGTTTIISSHYIDEMRLVDTVGVMKNGIIVAEASPQTLMTLHETTVLEDVVLKYHLQAEHDGTSLTHIGTPALDTISLENKQSNLEDVGDSKDGSHGDANVPEECNKKTAGAFKRSKALMGKNIVVIMRNIWFSLFLVVLPTIVLACFGLAVGHYPKNLSLGFVNDEVVGGCSKEVVISTCQPKDLSCAFSDMLDSLDMFEMKNYRTTQDALNAGLDNEIWGYVHVRKNFSQDFYKRTVGENTTKATIDGSVISMRLDMSRISTGLMMKKVIFETYFKFVRQLLSVCKIYDSGQARQIEFGEPIYGSDNSEYTIFVMTGILIAFKPFLCCMSTTICYILEKKHGMLDRARMAGVTAYDVIMAHAHTQFVLVMLQVLLDLVCLYIFGLSFGIVTAISAYMLGILSAASGIALGFLAAEIFDRERNAMFFALALLFPNFVFSGLMWPHESLPGCLQILSYIFPGTVPGMAFRAMLFRGRGMMHSSVGIGFISQYGFIACTGLLTFAVHKLRLKNCCH